MFTFLFLIAGAAGGAILASGGVDIVHQLTDLTLSGDLQQISGLLQQIVWGAKQQTLFGAAGGAIAGTLVGKIVDGLFQRLSRLGG